MSRDELELRRFFQVLSTLAFGFIRDFRQAIILRLIEGAVNGNTAMIRTMVSEVVKERRFVIPLPPDQLPP